MKSKRSLVALPIAVVPTILAELKIKDMTAKLKYHQTSDIEITEKLNKGQTVVYQVKGKLIENQELIKKHENSCGRFILATNILGTTKLAPKKTTNPPLGIAIFLDEPSFHKLSQYAIAS